MTTLGSAGADSSRRSGVMQAIVALSTLEIDEFLGGSGVQKLTSLLPGAKWWNPDDASDRSWTEHWDQLQPRLLVSGWRTPPIPNSATSLRYVCHLVGSVRRLIPRQLMRDGLIVTNWGVMASPFVAEHALLLILGALRSMPQWSVFMSEPFTHEDKNRLATRSLHGRRVAIHGFGGIARELIRILQPFHVTISAYSAGVPVDLMRQHRVTPVPSLQALAESADVLVCCEALTDATRNAIDTSVLTRLAPGSVFVNVARGAIVDEAALVKVAAERGLRIASDVFVDEPLPPNSPMRAIHGALYSPHIAGPTLDQYARCGASAMANLQRYFNGLPLENVVDLEAYDRST